MTSRESQEQLEQFGGDKSCSQPDWDFCFLSTMCHILRHKCNSVGGRGGDNLHFFDLVSVHRGIHFSDNSKHFCNISSVSIVQKTLPGPNYFFMSGAARRGALAQRHKGGRPAGRRLKIASIGTQAAGALHRYVTRSHTDDRDKRINGMF